MYCWLIWKRRNDAIFNDNKWTDWFMLNQIHDLHDLVIRDFDAQPSHRPPREVIWPPPPANCFKLNVDGSFFGNSGNSDFGGLIICMGIG